MRKAFFKNWYGGSCEAVINFINHFNNIIEEHLDEQKKEIFNLNPKALIIPHAGWIYSGFTANFAYKIAANNKYNGVAVIGPSHKFAFNGISTTLEEEYEIPCKNLKIDTLTSKELINNFNVSNLEYVHSEHSTEVQIPFIEYYFDNIKVIELIYSNYLPIHLKEIIKYLISKNFLVVISSDLSHYYNIQTANKLDSFCLEAVHNLDISYLKECEACGKIGIEGVILASKEMNLTPLIVDYRTSADVSGDKNQVVGYMSAIFI